MATTQAIQQESLTRAVSGQSFANYKDIFEGFMRKGIPEQDIKPRENVFTYNAWKALGRQVRKGEHGVKCLTFIQCESKETDAHTGEKKSFRRPWSTTVFHVSQTDKIGGAAMTAPLYVRFIHAYIGELGGGKIKITSDRDCLSPDLVRFDERVFATEKDLLACAMSYRDRGFQVCVDTGSIFQDYR